MKTEADAQANDRLLMPEGTVVDGEGAGLAVVGFAASGEAVP